MSKFLRELLIKNLSNENEIIEFFQIKEKSKNFKISKEELKILYLNELRGDFSSFNDFCRTYLEILSSDKNWFLDQIIETKDENIIFKEFKGLMEVDSDKYLYTQTFVHFLIELYYYDKFNVYINLFQKQNSLYFHENNILILNFLKHQMFKNSKNIDNIINSRILNILHGGFCKTSLFNSHNFLFNKDKIHFYKDNKLFILKEYIVLSLLLKIRTIENFEMMFEERLPRLHNVETINNPEDYLKFYKILNEENILKLMVFLNSNVDEEFFYKFKNMTADDSYFIFEYENSNLLEEYFNQNNIRSLKHYKENKDLYKKLEKKYAKTSSIYLNNFVFCNPMISSKYFIDPIFYGRNTFEELEINFCTDIVVSKKN